MQRMVPEMTPAITVRAPASELTVLREKPPVTGKPLKKAVATFASPRPSSSKPESWPSSSALHALEVEPQPPDEEDVEGDDYERNGEDAQERLERGPQPDGG